MSRQLYVVCREPAEVSAVQHNDDLLIFVRIDTLGQICNRATYLLQQVIGSGSGSWLHHDLVVWHLHGGKLQKNLLKNAGFGSPLLYRGRLYYSSREGDGQYTQIRNWLWADSGFVALGRLQNLEFIEALRSRSSSEFSPSGSTFKPEEGWREVTANEIDTTDADSPTENRTSINVAKAACVLEMQQSGAGAKPYWRSYTLQAVNLKPNRVLLYSWQDRELAMSKEDFVKHLNAL